MKPFRFRQFAGEKETADGMNGFSKFAGWWSRVMAGRHGADQFSMALLVAYCILLFLGNLFGSGLLSILALAALIYCVWRMLSRDHERRWRENSWFLSWWNPVCGWFRSMRSRFRSEQSYAAMKARDRAVYRYYRCPKCGNRLRVPKGKGRIVVTCPVCRTEFTKKT